jgi:hypothetical protein
VQYKIRTFKSEWEICNGLAGEEVRMTKREQQIDEVMAAVTPAVDFNALESFHLLFKNLWSMNIAYRVKLNVVDTVLYKEGKPFCWLFTSEQTGVRSQYL